jgi:protein-disulfide isomerase
MNRRQILGIPVAVAAVVGGGVFAGRYAPFGMNAAQAQDAAAPTTVAGLSYDDIMVDRIIGNADAPVTIIEYASLTCPHCAAFQADTLPELKKEFIDTGRVKMILREFPLDGLALRAAMMARCAPPARYEQLVNVLFSSQGQWARAKDPISALANIGKLSGMDAATVEACLSDQALADRVIQVRLDGEKQFGIASTPTFIVQGRKVEGAQGFGTFKKIIEEFGG